MSLTDLYTSKDDTLLELKMWMINASVVLGYRSLYDALIFLSKFLLL